MKKKHKRYHVFVLLLLVLGVGFSAVTFINLYIKNCTKKQIIEKNVILEEYDCILVLGAGVRGNQPSPMLADRLEKAIKLYNQGAAPKIIMSGDHGQKNYDEVNIMKQYAIEKGIPSEDIFMDHAGFSTYDSVYRAKNIFGAKKVLIVTQEYHLYRALYISNCLDMEANGIGADLREYAGQTKREIREVIARNKDFLKCITKPSSKYLGDAIDLNSSGDITND